ncbi:MAG: zf-HC2 domain-containing protein [Acidobacteriia bacterium]|nr:zf-HC2 domain-containing protein [Terriglobia bacterium]
MDLLPCPADPDETTEAYLLGRLPENESAAFEDHFLSCPQCSEHLQFTKSFIDAMRNAAKRTLQSLAVSAGR